MIKSLHVSDYALIDSLSLSPHPNLNILTGETGAGKSIILGALSLVMGARADTSALRPDGKKCVIEASIDIDGYGLEKFFSDLDLDYENPTIIRREITPSGKSRAFINDTPVLLDTLSSLATHLIDIHSQHQTLLLSHREYRINTLDTYCGNDVLLTLYKDALAAHKTAVNECNALKERQQSLKKSDDYSRYLLSELIEAHLEKNEEEETETLIERLSNAQKIKEALYTSNLLLNEDDNGIIHRIRTLRRELNDINRFFPPESDVENRMENIHIELKDIASEISSFLSYTEEDPTLLSQAEERLSLIHSLKKKHGVDSIEALMEIEQRLSHEIGILSDIDNEIQEAENKIKETEQTLKQAGRNLYLARSSQGETFASYIQSIIRTLGMSHAVFQVMVKHSSTYGNDGMDDVEFMFSANEGSPTQHIEKNASGGELSRVMLAIKCSLAEKSHLPTLVLDEIDTGVSGEIADRMGSLMQKMGRRMQVIVITHLPQIAARGDIHMKVYKEVTDGETYSRMRVLSNEERITEIAGMISGSSISDAAIAHAKELLGM